MWAMGLRSASISVVVYGRENTSQICRYCTILEITKDVLSCLLLAGMAYRETRSHPYRLWKHARMGHASVISTKAARGAGRNCFGTAAASRRRPSSLAGQWLLADAGRPCSMAGRSCGGGLILAGRGCGPGPCRARWRGWLAGRGCPRSAGLAGRGLHGDRPRAARLAGSACLAGGSGGQRRRRVAVLGRRHAVLMTQKRRRRSRENSLSLSLSLSLTHSPTHPLITFLSLSPFPFPPGAVFRHRQPSTEPGLSEGVPVGRPAGRRWRPRDAAAARLGG